MITDTQLEVWTLELSNFFVRNYRYQLITLNQETQEVWLYNKDHESSPVIMISSKPTQDWDLEALLAHRNALGLLIDCRCEGINISVNPESTVLDDMNVLVGVDTVSSDKALEMFGGLDNVLKSSKNVSSARNRAMQSLRKSMRRLQKMSNFKNTIASTIISGVLVVTYLISFLMMINYEINPTTALVMLGAYSRPMIVLANEWWRFITPMFLHGDFFHLLMNTLALRNIASILERELGYKKFLTVLVSGVFFGSAFVFLRGEHVIAIGISAGIYALLGVLLVYLYERDLYKNRMILNSVISTVMLNVFLSLMPGVSFTGHLGGLYIGIFFGFAFSTRKDWSFIRKVSSFLILASFVFVIGYMVVSPTGATPSVAEIDAINQWHKLGFTGYAERLLRLLIR